MYGGSYYIQLGHGCSCIVVIVIYDNDIGAEIMFDLTETRTSKSYQKDTTSGIALCTIALRS